MVHEVALQWDARAKKRITDSRTKFLPEVQRFPSLKKFPLFVQMRLVEQIKRAEGYIEDGVPIRQFKDKLVCRCTFYRQYQLPCLHLWQREIQYGVFTEQHWEDWAFMFEEAGLEAYETWGLQYVEKNNVNDEEQTVEERQTLRAREQWERLRSKWFNFMEETLTLPAEGRYEARQAWIDGLTHAIGPFMRATAREFMASIDPEQRVINREAAFPKGESQEVSGVDWSARLEEVG